MSTHDQTELHELLPGLPNHLAILCLSPLNPSLLYKVCKSWRRLIYSPDFPPFFALYAVLTQIDISTPASSSSDPDNNSFSDHQRYSHSINLACFEPVSSRWWALPGPPPIPSPRTIIRRHPSYISWAFPIQSIATSNKLVLISATTDDFLPALPHPPIFDPRTAGWSPGPSLQVPRRWCVAGSAHGRVYVASGMAATYDSDVARSVERWDLSGGEESGWGWERLAPLRDGRFSREAIEAVGYGGNKVCMVNVKGRAEKDGAVYDVAMDQWEEMPRGMVRGWNGPAAVDDCDDGSMYVVDSDDGSVSFYDGVGDRWVGVVGGLECLRGAEQVAVRRGKVCVVAGDGGRIVVVDVVARPPEVWVVVPPGGTEVVAVHVLLRVAISEANQVVIA